MVGYFDLKFAEQCQQTLFLNKLQVQDKASFLTQINVSGMQVLKTYFDVRLGYLTKMLFIN
jgi:hypothetical protein